VKKERLKIGICTPSTGNCRIEFAESIARLQRFLAVDSFVNVADSKLFYWCSSVIPMNRHMVVNQALNWGATHILFIDDDMSFDYEVIRMLIMSHKLDMVAANCVKRVYPTAFMTIGLDGEMVRTTDESSGLEEVNYTGNACILIRAEVFRGMEKPWFAFPYLPSEDHFETEDYFFQRKARALGHKIYIDHDASKRIIHIGSHNFDYKASFQQGGKSI
jgi:hypothetical protein